MANYDDLIKQAKYWYLPDSGDYSAEGAIIQDLTEAIEELVVEATKGAIYKRRIDTALRHYRPDLEDGLSAETMRGALMGEDDG